MIEQLNSIASWWWTWSVAMFWQVGVLIVLIACIDRLTRRWTWPQLRYALWSLVLIKLILPPTLSLPVSIVPKLAPVVTQALSVTTNEDRRMGNLFTHPDPGAIGSETAWENELSILPVDSTPASAVYVQEPAATFESELVAVAPAPGPALDWRVYALGFWLLGSGALAVFLTLRLRCLGRTDRSTSKTTSLPESFYNRLRGCADRLGLRRLPRVVVTDSVTCPAVFGVFRPVLLVPHGYLAQLSGRDTEHMLLHELAHLKRGDLLAHGLYMLLQVVYWYNPLLWLVRRQVHHLRELCCDATVANLLREKTGAYRQTLLEIARRFLATRTEPGLGLLGLFEDSNRLLIRLNWLEKPTWRYKNMKRAIVITIVGVMFACVLPMAHSQTPPIVEATETITVEATPEQNTKPIIPVARAGATVEQVRLERREAIESQDESALARERAGAQLDQIRRQMAQLQGLMQQLNDQMASLERQRAEFIEDEATGQTYQTYDVRPGDTLITIARQFSDSNGPSPEQTVAKIVEANQLQDDQIQVGQQLWIPLSSEQAAEIRAEMDMAWQRLQDIAAKQTELAQAEQAFRNTQSRVSTSTNLSTRGGRGTRRGTPTARSTSPQSISGTTIELTLPERMPLTQLLEMVSAQTNENYVYDPEVVRGDISLKVNGPVPVDDLHLLLESALKTKGLVMERREGNVIVIVPGDNKLSTDLLDIASLETPATPILTAEATVDADYVIKSLQYGTELKIVNNVGSMNIRRGPGRNCSIKVRVEVKGATPAEAEEIAKEVLIHVTPTERQVIIGVDMPDNISQEKRESIQVHFEMTVPSDCDISAAQKTGDIHLTGSADDQDRIRLQTKVGNIRIENIQFGTTLQADVGDITVVLPPNPSTTIRASAQVGKIESDLPLDITSAAVVRPGQAQSALGSSAIGVLGDGGGDDGMVDMNRRLELKTNVGSIHIWSVSAAEAAGL